MSAWPRVRPEGLWRHADFMKLWTGQTVSLFGSTITREALPLAAVLSLHASPALMGLLAAARSAPVIVAGLFAGVWVDRLRRRPLMIAADLARAALLLSIPLAAIFHVLSIGLLFVVAPLIGVLSVCFDAAYQSYVPSLVSREQILEANAKLGLTGSLAEVTAPGITGVLVQTITAPFAILIDAVTFLVSALSVAMIRSTEPQPAQARQSIGREIGEGLRAIAGNRLLRSLAATLVTRDFFGNFFAALYALYAIRVLGLGPALLGLTVACGGLGDLLGVLMSMRLARRFGVGRAMIGAYIVGGVVSLLLPAAGGPVITAAIMLMVAQLLGDAARAIFDIHALTLRQAVTPDRLLGRVNAGMNMAEAGIGPFGALAGGLLATAIGTRQTVLVAVLGGMLAGAWLVFSPLRDLRDLPVPS